MNIEYQPEDLTLTNKFGAYSISIKHQGNNIIYMRRMALNEGQYPCSDYQEFAGFLKQIARLDEEKIVLLKK